MNLMTTGVRLSTKEIAERFNQSLRSVRVAARAMLAELGLPLSNYAHGEDYMLPKDEAIMLAMQYNVHIRKALIDYIKELESRLTTLPNFNDPVAAARAWADSQEQLKLAAPKVEFADAIAASSDSENVGEFCKALGYGYNKGLKALRIMQILKTGRSSDSEERNKPFSEYMTKFEVVQERATNGYYNLVTYIRPEAKAWLHSKLKEHFGE